jgi:transposase
VKADLDAKSVDPAHDSVGWDLASLRWAWNRAKHEVAPWWAENSKEAYSSGLADLSQALDNWKTSKDGQRRGRRVGFPRFKSARQDAGRVRFTTGTMRLDSDRRTIVLPRIGPLRSKDNTRRLQRQVAAGRGHILNMTLSERWGRLFVSVSYALRTPENCRLVGKGRIDKHLLCPRTGEVVDRDKNAALNLRDWPDHASCGPVGATVPSVPGPTTLVGTGHGADAGASGAGGASVRPRIREARSGEAKTQTPQGDAA